MKHFLLVLGSIVFVIGLTYCASIEKATGTHTYILSTQQLEDIKTMLHIASCPEGKQAVAMTIESASGGATLTVRCQ